MLFAITLEGTFKELLVMPDLVPVLEVSKFYVYTGVGLRCLRFDGCADLFYSDMLLEVYA